MLHFGLAHVKALLLHCCPNAVFERTKNQLLWALWKDLLLVLAFLGGGIEQAKFDFE